MKKVFKIFKWVVIGIISLFVLLIIIGIFAPGTIQVKGEDGQTDDVSLATSSYITDENYEPEEKELLSHTIAVFNHLDMHEWGEVDNFFREYYVQETELAKAYGVWETNPEEIVSIDYVVENKEFTAYLDETEVTPISVNNDNGIEWDTYPYDVWIDFSFELTREVELENGKTKKDKFEVMGNYPPLWNPDNDETRWYLGNLLLRSVETSSN
jgi:hypothetical protein